MNKKQMDDLGNRRDRKVSFRDKRVLWLCLVSLCILACMDAYIVVNTGTPISDELNLSPSLPDEVEETETRFPDPTRLTASSAVETEELSSLDVPIPGTGCIPANPRAIARVIRVIDGDTIEVEMDGRLLTVRYIGIDTPETVAPGQGVEEFGPEATQKNQELVEYKEVFLIRDVSTTDRYGRLLSYVIVDDIFVNYELVRQGFANAVTYTPDVSCAEVFLEAENLARKEKIGLWSVNGQD